MAHLDPKGNIVGSIGQLVFRNVNGKILVQAKPEKTGKYPSGRSKQSATDFGRASRTTSALVRGLRPFIGTNYDSQWFNRFRKTVYQGMKTNTPLHQGNLDFAQGSPEVLEGLEFNLQTPYPEYVQLPGLELRLDAGKLLITLPEFKTGSQLYWPKEASTAELCYWISAYAPSDYQTLHQELFSIPIPHRTATIPASRYTTAELPQDSLTLVTAGILFYTSHTLRSQQTLNSKAFNPAQVLRVFRT
ncbi:hypothetical protein [Leeuwenhoekiella marinoflava]|uniref:hypothetical protein n=1 Tax=Leeuwenhoekiella marinoflava TaxID=988 RepID=UPI003001D9DD